MADLPFYELFHPWMDAPRARLSQGFPDIHSYLLPEALKGLERSLPAKWSRYASPSLALELGICRMEQSLKGTTPQERYQDFIQKLDSDAFFKEYQGLKRFVNTFTELWLAQAEEFLVRLKKDHAKLEEFFHDKQPLGKVASIATGFSDPHNGGRSVYLVKFESGKELFYKPKNLYITVAFYELLERLNQEGLEPRLHGYRVLTCGDYGWEEKVEQLPCLTQEEVSLYFERAGMLLCLLYLFDGSDMHHENIIAMGAHPMLVDLETLFHPRFSERHEMDDVFNRSVIGTLFLPAFLYTLKEKKAFDVSGLSGYSKASCMLPVWKNMGTDELVLLYENTMLHAGKHSVSFQGKAENAADYVEEIVRGFKKMYQFIEERRPILLEWLEQVKTAQIRVVLRGTHIYSCFLERLRSPQVLFSQDILKQEFKHLKNLKNSFFARQEKNALLQGDVPYFYTQVGGRGIYALGEKAAHNKLKKSPLFYVQKRLQTMNEENAERQVQFIHQSFLIKNKSIKYKLKRHKKEISNKLVLEKAKEVGRMILNRGIRCKDGSLGWIHLELLEIDGPMDVRPMGPDLYSGKIGVALLFAALFHVTQEESWKQEALNCLKSLRISRAKKKMWSSQWGIGGMVGMGSVIFGFLSIGKLLKMPVLIQESLEYAQAIEPSKIRQDQAYDVLAGGGGLILSLLALWQETKQAQLLRSAELCGDFLSKKMQTTGEGGFWEQSNGMPLLGLSHGNAGMAFVLAKLGCHTQKTRFWKNAEKVLAFERAHFCPQRKCWPRFGDSFEEKTWGTSWCHGATGIGLARLKSLPYFQDEKFLNEITHAVKKTEKDLFENGLLHPCCGLAGRLEFLHAVSLHLPQIPLKYSQKEMASLFFHHYTQAQKSNSRALELSSFGFMQGLSGIGYTLLKLIDTKDELPSVLTLS